jgi:RNA polymerase-binding transcription factor DksA
MSSLAQYRAKHQELTTRAQGDKNPFTRAVLENFALSYLRLAEHEEKRQREKAWGRLAIENGWRCECGRPISYAGRDIYFRTKLCAPCYRALQHGELGILTELHCL